MSRHTYLGVAAVLFDICGTLIDSDSLIEHSWLRWSVEMGLDPVDVLPRVHGQPGREVMAALLPERDDQLNTADQLECLRREEGDVRQIRPQPGAADLLSSLGEVPWAVVTSSPRELGIARLRAAGLPVPTVVVGADDVAEGKPSPECYLAAARGLGVPPFGCLVIEDSEPGVRAALAANMLVIGVGHRVRYCDPAPTSRVETLDQLRLTQGPEWVVGVLRDAVFS